LQKKIDICQKIVYNSNKERELKLMEWTKEQKDAILKKDSNILVSAAARKWKNCCFS